MMLPPPFLLAIAAGLAALALGALALATFELGRRSGARATAKHLSARAKQAEDRAATLEATASRERAQWEARAAAAQADAARTTRALSERAEELEAQFRSVKADLDMVSDAVVVADSRALDAEARLVAVTEESRAAVAAAEETVGEAIRGAEDQARETVVATEERAKARVELAEASARALVDLAEASARSLVDLAEASARETAEHTQESARAATERAEDAERNLADVLMALVQSRREAVAATERTEAERAGWLGQMEELREARRVDAEAWASTARQLAASEARESNLHIRRDGLTALARRVARQEDLAAVEEAAAALLAATLHVDLAGVFDLDFERQRAVLRAGAGWRPEQVHHAVMHVMEGGLAACALETEGPVVVKRALTETRFLIPPVLVAERVVSGVTVRIPGEPHPAGVLGVYTRAERSFSEADAAFIAAIAAQVGAVASRRRAAQAQRLAELRTALVLETVEDALLVADQRGRIVAASQSAESFFGAPPRSLAGRPLTEMLETIEEGSFDLAQALAKEWVHPNGGVRGWLVARRGDASLVPARIWAGVRQREGTGHVLLRLTAASRQETAEHTPGAAA